MCKRNNQFFPIMRFAGVKLDGIIFPNEVNDVDRYKCDDELPLANA
jgi:hypothetical protein